MHGCVMFSQRLRSLLSLFTSALIFVIAAHAQNGAVSFVSSQPIPLANACRGALTGHFHYSAKSDFMTVCYQGDPSPSTAFLNQGNGVYTPVVDAALQFEGWPLLAVDLNGDGIDDLVIQQAFNDTAFGVQLANGDGTFQNPVYYSPTVPNLMPNFTAVAGGDFNGDGKMDVAVLTTQVVTVSGVESFVSD